MARPAPDTKKRTVPGLRLARGVCMKLIYTNDMCRADAQREEAAGDPDFSAGCNGCENCTDDMAPARGMDVAEWQELFVLRGRARTMKLALAAKNEAESRELKAAQEADELRASIKAVLNHWREFGPGHGFDECVERAAAWALGPNVEVTCPPRGRHRRNDEHDQG
jgi:cytochrome c5